MTVTSSCPSPAIAPEAVRTTPPSAKRGSRWFLKWTLAAKATAAMTTVRRIDNVAERFMGQLSFFVGRAVFECCCSTWDGSPSHGGARARVERDRADATVQNPYAADPRCW